MIIPTHDEIKQFNIEAEKLEKIVNNLLRQKAYDQLVKRFENKEAKILACKNQKIHLLEIMVRLIQYEIVNTGRTSLEGKDATQIIRIYQIVSLYLRRIEFDFPVNLQQELLLYLNQEGISLELLVGIIMNNTKIVHKQKIIKCLSGLIE